MPPSQVRNCRHNLSIVQEKIDKVPCTGTGHVILCNWRCEHYYQILWGCTVWSYICIVFSIKYIEIYELSHTWLLLHCKSVGGQGLVWTWEISWLSSKELWLKGSLALDHLAAIAAMGNHACCGHNAVAEPEAVAPVPENAEKPQEETVETLELAAKDVIIETTSKEVEEIPSPPTSPSSADMRKAFGGKVVSSCSLQGIHVDEDAEAKKQITAQRLRADTQQSVMSMMLVMMVMSCMSEVVSCFEILFGHLVLAQISWLVSRRIYAHPVGNPGQAPSQLWKWSLIFSVEVHVQTSMVNGFALRPGAARNASLEQE